MPCYNAGSYLTVDRLLPSAPPPCSLQDSLGLVQDPTSQLDAVRDALVLLGALLFFRVAIYYVLRHKTSR